MPAAFFEVEHSTDIQNSLLKFMDLQDFYSNMYIVAAEQRRKEFTNKMNYSAFSCLEKEKRVTFLSYDDLEKNYITELKKWDTGVRL